MEHLNKIIDHDKLMEDYLISLLDIPEKLSEPHVRDIADSYSLLKFVYDGKLFFATLNGITSTSIFTGNITPLHQCPVWQKGICCIDGMEVKIINFAYWLLSSFVENTNDQRCMIRFAKGRIGFLCQDILSSVTLDCTSIKFATHEQNTNSWLLGTVIDTISPIIDLNVLADAMIMI